MCVCVSQSVHLCVITSCMFIEAHVVGEQCRSGQRSRLTVKAAWKLCLPTQGASQGLKIYFKSLCINHEWRFRPELLSRGWNIGAYLLCWKGSCSHTITAGKWSGISPWVKNTSLTVRRTAIYRDPVIPIKKNVRHTDENWQKDRQTEPFVFDLPPSAKWAVSQHITYSSLHSQTKIGGIKRRN